MYLDPQDSLRLSINVAGDRGEKAETRVIRKNVMKGNVVVDIGGHIGFYTLMLSKLVGETGKVYTFEPNPDNFKLLEKNVKENNIQNVTLINKALSDKKQKSSLYLNKDNSGGHSLHRKGSSKDFVEVDTTTLDLCFKDTKLDFIKMDAEGSEGHIVQGGKRLFRQESVRLLTEYNPCALDTSGFGKEKFLAFLSENGFSFHQIDSNTGETAPVKISELLSSEGVKNILCEKEVSRK